MKLKRTVASIVAFAMMMSSLSVSYAGVMSEKISAEITLTDTVISDSALEMEENINKEEAVSDVETKATIDDLTGISDNDVVDLNASYVVTYAVGGGDIYFDMNSGTVVSADKLVMNVDIPMYIYGEKVRYIGKSAFRSCLHLRKVVLPNSVTILDEFCFAECLSLESISIPDSVTYMGWGCFLNCTNLKSIDMPKEMTDDLWVTFSGCTNLKSIVVPRGITHLNSTFEGCSSLSNVVLPDGLKEIGGRSFEGCSSLYNIVFPDSLEKIESFAFSGSALNSITIPQYVNSIDEFSFDWQYTYYDYSEGQYVTELTGNLKEIKVDKNNMYYADEDGVLFNKNKTELIAFPPGKNIQSYSVPFSVKTIDYAAFNGNIYIESITIPSNAINVLCQSFGTCSNLKSINVDANNTAYSSEQGVLFNKNKTKLIAAPGGLKNYNVPRGVLSIEVAAFENCTFLKNVTISDTVTSIKNCAFEYCKALTGIVIPASVTSIEVGEFGSSAFAGCDENNLIFYVEKDSYADTWAKEHGWKVSYDIPVYQKGDVNNDGVIDSKDSLRLLKHIAGHNVEIDSIAADVNGDGIVDSKDSLRLLKYIAGYDVVLQ